ncbi:sulfatase-like hydrolase/transferase [Spirabiliibacterium falconis]|uniref:sulfatase-like hydrolase/transferase n=1 Tax=Spirabiliibacterium falconis TaxID=572023 RepID=UPI001AAD996C|nr:sulfatase-like hydrolase/transferase [Spirabiliibacterium falconis]MBE2893694.1 sulfatase-like hydrolase/transferase [Spirabiliibacterium falconis]
MSRPNILFYFSDQQRWDTIGAYGQPLDVTPHLDALARQGVLFEEAYSPQPVCGPCRSIFQSGLYPTQTGCFRNNIALPLDTKTLADYFTENGYETAYIGKWHLASDGELEATPTIDYTITAIPPERRGGYKGFWRAADVLEFTSHGYDGFVFDENMNKCEFKGYRVDCITDFALEFLEQYNNEKPFFMTISHIEPHHQNDRHTYEGPEGSKTRFEHYQLPHDLKVLGGNADEMYPDYLGCCRSLDDNLGRVIDKLKEKGLFDNTIIIYASDHGSHFMTRNKDEHLNGYDDYKRSCHSSALHVPLIIAGPGYKGGLRIKDLVSTASLPKTFLAMAGIDVGDKMIGENLHDVVAHRDPQRKNEIFAQISESRIGRCIRTENYLYSVYAPNVHGGVQGGSDVYCDDFLYDLTKDPYELTNVVAEPEYQHIKAQLRERLCDLMVQAGEPRPMIKDQL